MNKSETIGKLALALSKVQGEIRDVYAKRENTFLSSRYADLSMVLAEVRPLLAQNELAVTQIVGSQDYDVTVETVLMHSSGEWISGIHKMPVQGQKGVSQAQSIGAIITYARRYGLAAICGVSQSDTDAHEDAAIYSVTQKAFFDKYINDEDGLALYLFKNRVGPDVYTELFNSGDKGEKTALKQKARDIEAKGAEVFVAITNAIDASDSLGLRELVEDEDNVTLSMLKHSLNASQMQDFNALLSE